MTKMAHHETCGICHTSGPCEHSKNRLIEELTKSALERPSFDQVYMDFAVSLSRRSTCGRAQVGCVVVTGDNHRVLSVGYNGGPKGVFNECLSSEPGKCGHLHAEINALIKMNYNDPATKKLYTTTIPCFNCAVAIINAGINEVIYLNEYRLTDGVELLRKANIPVRKHGEKG